LGKALEQWPPFLLPGKGINIAEKFMSVAALRTRMKSGFFAQATEHQPGKHGRISLQRLALILGRVGEALYANFGLDHARREELTQKYELLLNRLRARIRFFVTVSKIL
jgi:hypothetical protein